MTSPLPLRFVLLRTRSAENLGACARALKNCGFADWVHVDRQVPSLEDARRTAVHAEELLSSARVVSTLDEALADCVWVVGTSSRQVRGKRRLPPREVAAEAVERAAEGPVAIVFGDERSGLRAEEVERCHDLSVIPSGDAQPSFNLAQAVLLYAYELQLAAGTHVIAPSQSAPLPVAAPDAQLQNLHAALGTLLTKGGFLRDDRDALQRLFIPLRRARLSRREAELWTAALASVAKRLD